MNTTQKDIEIAKLIIAKLIKEVEELREELEDMREQLHNKIFQAKLSKGLSKERIEKLILDMQETIEKREKAPTHILQSDRFKLAEQIHNAINTKE